MHVHVFWHSGLQTHLFLSVLQLFATKFCGEKPLQVSVPVPHRHQNKEFLPYIYSRSPFFQFKAITVIIPMALLWACSNSPMSFLGASELNIVNT